MPLQEGYKMKDHFGFRLRRVGSPATFPGIGDVFSLNKGVNIIGRNPSKSDIFLDSMKHKALISRLHARIINNTESGKAEFRICDTSLNGTYINDKKILDTAEVKPGDTVTFGHLRGAVLNPGTISEQPTSEFRFKLEKFPPSPCRNKKGNSSTTTCREKTCNANDKGRSDSPVLEPVMKMFIPDLSPFLSSRTTADKNSVVQYSATHQLQSVAEISQPSTSSISVASLSQNSDYNDDELFAYAAAAEDAMEESDDDLFSIDVPNNSRPEGACYNLSESPIYSQRLDVRTRPDSPSVNSFNLNEGEEKTEEIFTNNHTKPATGKAKRNSLSKYQKTKKPRRLEMREKYIPDTCAFDDCSRPHDRHDLVNWVQCDYCRKWYHLTCTGLTLKDVNKAVKFNCGCKYSCT